MKLFQCDCNVAQLTRLRRPWWMRLVPFMRLCYCRNCGSKVFMARNSQWWPYFVYTFYRRRSEKPQWEDTKSMPRQGPYERQRKAQTTW